MFPVCVDGVISDGGRPLALKNTTGHARRIVFSRTERPAGKWEVGTLRDAHPLRVVLEVSCSDTGRRVALRPRVFAGSSV
jgi:hypothetical protein